MGGRMCWAGVCRQLLPRLRSRAPTPPYLQSPSYLQPLYEERSTFEHMEGLGGCVAISISLKYYQEEPYDAP